MKNGFKNVLVFIIIICGLLSLVKYMLNLKEFILGSSTKSQSVSSNNNYKNDNNDTDINSQLLLVNEEHVLEETYIPKNLTIPNIKFASGVSNEEKHVAGIIAQPLEQLVSEAKKDGITLLGNSGYRSYKTQQNTYNNRVLSEGEKLADAYVARPGYSEHQTGLCIDITNQGKYFAKGTKEADWLAKNCYRFGFIIRYPYGKKNITGIEYEPWHIRYVGKNTAKYIYDNNITLEEYLDK
ncbi:M15 family metallopeptidase [Clostridium folliculivorans]|uniref:D-alanyl-D-alanine carboxypeptidase n=1 Tax=Clostridium folliculivorans TaxID=2886038 RepID=A0A9W6D8X5_9CLOT|nr:M15 family metallopeptidase [Clostridium folliculivorans]GKU23341.1 D-alanyl-D-alanine carboxypeptidase [Clostridium folliculivorans]GKU29458.1 D-alanyl-D-alanine carboxypeptidase [Clostridium folliculivorans]